MENNSSDVDVSNLICDNIAINIATTHSYKLTLSPDLDGACTVFAKKRMLTRRRHLIKIRYSRAASGSNMESA